jgi:hypothetical protein
MVLNVISSIANVLNVTTMTRGLHFVGRSVGRSVYAIEERPGDPALIVQRATITTLADMARRSGEPACIAGDRPATA